MSALEDEIAYRRQTGCSVVSVADMAARFEAIGYKLDRRGDCRANASYMSGPRAGMSYPACTTWVNESDTGVNAFSVHARRDANFAALQALRDTVCAVSRGAILEV